MHSFIYKLNLRSCLHKDLRKDLRKETFAKRELRKETFAKRLTQSSQLASSQAPLYLIL